MHSEIEFKIVRGKGSYGGNPSVKTIGDVLKINS